MVNPAKDPLSTRQESALDQLCELYRTPVLKCVLAFLVGDKSEAEDLTQSFFLKFVEQMRIGIHREMDRRGPFRCYLTKCLTNFIKDELRGAQRKRRGGGALELPLDGLDRSDQDSPGLQTKDTPERCLKRECAKQFMNRIQEKALQEYRRMGKGALCEELLKYERGENDGAHRQIASHLGSIEGTVRVEAHRLRKRLGRLFKAEVAPGVRDDQQLKQEVKDLLRSLSME